jgi:sigma-B regulation protein RsbU (phosphoserine phosphatase)
MTSTNNPQHTSDRLALLYRLSQTFNTSLDLNEVLNRVIDEVIEILHAERGFVMLLGPDDSQTFNVARGLDRKTIDQPQFQISQSVVLKVIHEGQPILTSDAQSDSRFSMRQSIMLLGLRSILCVPLKVKDEVRGVVYADNRFEAGIFTQADLDLLSAITSIAAIAVENARLYLMAVEKGRMQRELQMARDMQDGFLPQETPQVDGWQFAARWQPAREVAGDYFDFITVGQDAIGLVIADVTDKGAPAALFMVFTSSIVRGSVHNTIPPAESISSANRLICEKSTNAMFVSLVYAQVKTRTGELIWVNAGHNPPVYYNSREDRLHRLLRTGMVLGIDPETPYTQQTLTMDRGDFLLLYTDGLTDAIDANEQEFGVKRMEALAYQYRQESAESILNRMMEAVMEHSGETTPFDDVTIVVVKRI